ncbi:MAG: PilZ domain-containing protein [Desulfobacterales bacterium]|nr:PilZ domain-containing protein [Desulfobacterales bacterium]
MKEKRRLERFDLELPATIELLTPDQEKRLLNLLTTNICSGGAYFHTTEPLPKGTQVKIDLVLPLEKLRKLKEEYKQAYIKVTGTVLRSESEGMAICFDEDYQLVGSAK